MRIASDMSGSATGGHNTAQSHGLTGDPSSQLTPTASSLEPTKPKCVATQLIGSSRRNGSMTNNGNSRERSVSSHKSVAPSSNRADIDSYKLIEKRHGRSKANFALHVKCEEISPFNETLRSGLLVVSSPTKTHRRPTLLHLPRSASSARSAQTAPASAISAQLAFQSVVDIPSTMRHSTSDANESLFMTKVKMSSEAIQRGDYRKAILLYSEALQLDPDNYTLYSNRAAAYLRVGMYDEALIDARNSTRLKPDWIKGYMREGIALDCLGRLPHALLAFAHGLTKDPTSVHLLAALVQSTLKSPLKGSFETIYGQLKQMKLETSPFVVLSVLGQLLLADKSHASTSSEMLQIVGEILECALTIGSDNPKLQSSVYSTLAYVYWVTNKLDKAIAMMQQDLRVSTQLDDLDQQCRAHGNLGSAFFAKRSYKQALASYRMQLALSMRLQRTSIATNSLKHLSTLYKVLGDKHNALLSAKQCVVLLQQQLQYAQFDDHSKSANNTNPVNAVADVEVELRFSLAEQISNCAGLHLALNKLNLAVECLDELSKLLDALRSNVCLRPNERLVMLDCEMHFHYGNLYKSMRQYGRAEVHLCKLLHLTGANCPGEPASGPSEPTEHATHDPERVRDQVARLRHFSLAAYAALGAIALYQRRDLARAKQCFQRQLDCALKIHSKQQEAHACCNLAQVYAALNDHAASRRLFKFCVKQARQLRDLTLLAHAFGHLGTLYRSMHNLDAAIRCFRSQLNIILQRSSIAGKQTNIPSKSQNQRELMIAHYNLGKTYLEMQQSANALTHLYQLLELSRACRSFVFESEALYQIASYYLKKRELLKAIPFFEQDLILVQEMHSSMLQHKQTDKRISLGGIGEGDWLLSEANLRMKQSLLLNKLGFLHYELHQLKQAIVYFQQELRVFRDTQCSTDDRLVEAQARAHFNVALCNKQMRQYQMAMDELQRCLQLYALLGNSVGKLRTLYEVADVYSLMQQFERAAATFNQLLESLRQLDGKDTMQQSQQPWMYREFCAKVLNALGLTYFQMQQFELAEQYFVQALSLLQIMHDTSNTICSSLNTCCYLKCCVLKNLGALKKRLSNVNEGTNYFEQLLDLTARSRLNAIDLHMHAFNQLAQLKIFQGDYRGAIDFLNRELDAVQIMLRPQSATTTLSCATNTSSAYTLNSISAAPNTTLFTFGTANAATTGAIAAEHIDLYLLLGDAYTRLKFSQMNDANSTLQSTDSGALVQLASRYYEQACHHAEQAGDLPQQYQAYRGLAILHRRLCNWQQALVYYEKCLLFAHELNQPLIKIVTYSELGCLHALQQNYEQAISCLQHQLTIAREAHDQSAEAAAACSLGYVYSQMNEHAKALEFHQRELRLAGAVNDAVLLGRAYNNCSWIYETTRDYPSALHCQQLHLQIATDQNTKLLAYSSLGRLHHHLAHYQEAVQYFQAALQLAFNCGTEEQAKLHLRLALSLWATNNMKPVTTHLHRAVELFEQCFTQTCCQLPLPTASGAQTPMRNNARLVDTFDSAFRDTINSSAVPLRRPSDVDPASMHDMQTASYENLQKLLLAQQRIEDALSISERAQCISCYEFFLASSTHMTDDKQADSTDSSSASSPSTASTCSGDVSTVTASFVPQSPTLHHETMKQQNNSSTVTETLSASVKSISVFEYQPLTGEQIAEVTRRQNVHILHFSFVKEYLCVWFLSATNRQVRFHQVAFSRAELGQLVDTIRTAYGLSNAEIGSETKSMLESDLHDLLGNSETAPADATMLINLRPTAKQSAFTAQDRSQLEVSAMQRSASVQNLTTMFAFNINLQQDKIEEKRKIPAGIGTKARESSRIVSHRNKNYASAIDRLYTVLIAHFEADLREIETLQATDGAQSRLDMSPTGVAKPVLVLVASAEFLQVPFAILASHATRGKCLAERFSLVQVPSVSVLVRLQLAAKQHAKQHRSALQQLESGGKTGVMQRDVLVVGAPQLARSLELRWNMLKPTRHSERECILTANLFNTCALLREDVSKPSLVDRIRSTLMSNASTVQPDLPPRLRCSSEGVTHVSRSAAVRLELVHISLPICFRISSLLCSTNANFNGNVNVSAPSAVDESCFFSLGECLLRIEDIFRLGLRTRILVLTLTDTLDSLTTENTIGYYRLLNAFLSAGAECIIAQRWRTPDQYAHALLLKTLFDHLQQGVPAHEALSRAQAQLRNDSKFHHARYWAGWFCMGDVQTALTNQLLHLYSAVGELLRGVPYKEMRDAVRILLHLVEKSRARAELDKTQCTVPMFVSLTSLATRIGHSRFWPDVLRSIGFRIEQYDGSKLHQNAVSYAGESNFLAKPAADADELSLNNSALNDAGRNQMFVFFPQTNPGNRLIQSSLLFQAILGLPPSALISVGKLLQQRDLQSVGQSMMTLLVQALAQLPSFPATVQTAVQLKVNAQLWRIAGCHEFLASLGFDLVGISSNSLVIIKSSKQLKQRNLQHAFTLLSTLFHAQCTKKHGSIYMRDTNASTGNLRHLNDSPCHDVRPAATINILKQHQVCKPVTVVSGSTSQNVLLKNSSTVVVIPVGDSSNMGSRSRLPSGNTFVASIDESNLFKPINSISDCPDVEDLSRMQYSNTNSGNSNSNLLKATLEILPAKSSLGSSLLKLTANETLMNQKICNTNSDTDSIGPELGNITRHRPVVNNHWLRKPLVSGNHDPTGRNRLPSAVNQMSEKTGVSFGC